MASPLRFGSAAPPSERGETGSNLSGCCCDLVCLRVGGIFVVGGSLQVLNWAVLKWGVVQGRLRLSDTEILGRSRVTP